MIKLASFNIYGFPESFLGNRRDDADLQRIARVLASLDADALVFQEIISLKHLETLTESIAGHDYQLRKRPGWAWLTSGSTKSKSKEMKVVGAFDANVLELVAAAALRNPEGYPRQRDPYAMHLRVLATGWEFTLVGVHMKSGGLLGWDDVADKRLQEARFLADWLAGKAELGPDHEAHGFERPPTDDVIVLGDFNALMDHGSVAPLREDALKPWQWPQAQVVNSLDPDGLHTGVDDPSEQWTTYLDREVIDHAIVSPSMASRIETARIYAFDLDPALDEAPGEAAHWLRRRTDYEIRSEIQPNLFRISDHRPLLVMVNES